MLTSFCMQTKCQVQKESIDSCCFAGFLQENPPLAGMIPRVGKRRLKGAGKILILFAGWPLFGMNQ
jgi:hypothetical protein